MSIISLRIARDRTFADLLKSIETLRADSSSRSTEAHGPHLPLSADVIIAEEMAARAARTLESRGDPH